MTNKNFFKTKIFLFLLFFLMMGLTVLSFLVIRAREYEIFVILELEKAEMIEKQHLKNQQRRKTQILQIFTNSNFLAESVFVQNINSREVLYQENHKKKQPVASLTKIATALVVLRDVNVDQVVITREDLYQEGEYFLKIGETFEKEDLISFMLLNSSNDAARALSSKVSTNSQEFVAKMNDLALELQLDATFFFSDTGLDITSSVGGSYSNAEDINKLIIYFYNQYPQIAQKTSLENLEICSDVICHQVENTNTLLSEREEIIFSKTGYTDFSGGSLGIIAKINNELYSIIVLHSTKEGRFEDINKVIDNLYEIDEFKI